MTDMTSVAQESIGSIDDAEPTAPPRQAPGTGQDGDGTVLREHWGDLWQMIENLRQACAGGIPSKPGFPIDVLDEALKPVTVSSTLDYLLLTAIDHLHCLKTLVADSRNLHMFAPFTLVRSAIESSSAVIWALNPLEPAERAKRILRFEYESLRLSKAVYATLEEEARFSQRTSNAAEAYDVLAKQRNIVKALAKNLGMPGTALESKPTSTTMITDAYQAMGTTPMLLGWWQVGSGAAHGKSWPAPFLLAPGDDSQPQEWQQGNLRNLMTMVEQAVRLTISAVDLRVRMGGSEGVISQGH